MPGVGEMFAKAGFCAAFENTRGEDGGRLSTDHDPGRRRRHSKIDTENIPFEKQSEQLS